MKLLHILGRVALGAPFIVMGWGAAAEPGRRVKAAEDFGVPEPQLAVRINGGAMVAGGAALAVGVPPRPAATGLALALVPTTLAGHPFWKHDDPALKANHRIQFLKNLAMAGGLLAYATRD
ncbi:DoxX family membrane protein [Propionibacteriaceae bacterium Y1923]